MLHRPAQSKCYPVDNRRILLRACALGLLAAAALWAAPVRAESLQTPQLSWQEAAPAPKSTPNNSYYNSQKSSGTSGTYKMPSAVSRYMGANGTAGATTGGNRTGAKKKDCPELTASGDQLKSFKKPPSAY